jgi:hypothetical protein
MLHVRHNPKLILLKYISELKAKNYAQKKFSSLKIDVAWKTIKGHNSVKIQVRAIWQQESDLWFKTFNIFI